MTSLIHADAVTKSFHRGSEVVHALTGIELEVHPGEIVALVGPSGSGKTTLLYLLAGWEIPDSGSIGWTGDATHPATSPWERLALVPQSLGLSEELTVYENISFPLRMVEQHGDASTRVDEIVSRLDLEELTDRYPLETSLGEQQRVAVARALILEPTLLLADEPTSHQDTARTLAVFRLIGDLAQGGSSCVIATHDPDVRRFVDRVIEMRDGRIEETVRGEAVKGEAAVWGRPST